VGKRITMSDDTPDLNIEIGYSTFKIGSARGQ
jgi:hypothetical protein